MIEIGPYKFEDNCCEKCQFQHQLVYCARCPIFTCGQIPQVGRVFDPAKYRLDWAREWHTYFTTGKLPDLRPIDPKYIKISEAQMSTKTDKQAYGQTSLFASSVQDPPKPDTTVIAVSNSQEAVSEAPESSQAEVHTQASVEPQTANLEPPAQPSPASTPENNDSLTDWQREALAAIQQNKLKIAVVILENGIILQPPDTDQISIFFGKGAKPNILKVINLVSAMATIFRK